MRLFACPECARHVRTDAEACPFCGHTLAGPSASPSTRGRVAVLIGAAAISTLSACGRMAVKYGAPPNPPPEPSTGAEAPSEPEAPEAPSEPEAPAEPEVPAGEGG